MIAKHSFKSGYCIILIFMLLVSTNAEAQLLPKITKTLSDGADMIKSVGKLVDATKMSTAEFNKKVKVVKGNPTPPGTAPTAPVPTVGKVTEPKFKNGKFTNFDWAPVSYFDGQLFPSSIICMSTYKGQLTPILEAISRPLGFRLVSKASNIPLHWEIECVEKKYFDKVSGTVVFQTGGGEVDVQPEIPWNYETLGNQVSNAPINVFFRIYDDDGNKEEKTIPIYIRSINDCITNYKDQALDFLFTGYVQEQHPEIDKILKQALDTKMIQAIEGYQGGEGVLDMQVAAIWRVLHDRGFQYSSITNTTGNNNDIFSQEVRTFNNSLKTSQANCVDGTIVFASILRKIGVHTVLVLVPGHCFLGYYTNDDRTRIHYLETTLLSETNYYVNKQKMNLGSAKTPAAKTAAYKALFIQALAYGNMEFDEHKAKNEVTLIDVDQCRELVSPMPIYN